MNLRIACIGAVFALIWMAASMIPLHDATVLETAAPGAREDASDRIVATSGALGRPVRVPASNDTEPCDYPGECDRPSAFPTCDIEVARSPITTSPVGASGSFVVLEPIRAFLSECGGPGAYVVAVTELDRDGEVFTGELGANDRRDELLLSGLVTCDPASNGEFTSSSVTTVNVTVSAIIDVDGITIPLDPPTVLSTTLDGAACEAVGGAD